ncbi:MAG: hypothetical protein PWK00_06675, partial [Coxiella burnetii]|nr:hypothetical protein [Coxiella burnetii]
MQGLPHVEAALGLHRNPQKDETKKFSETGLEPQQKFQLEKPDTPQVNLLPSAFQNASPFTEWFA